MLANTRIIALARNVIPCLAQHQIGTVAFKGPFHQQQLHGDWFARRANDLDLLVPRDQFEAALAALERIGFRARGTSQWWKLSLGEVHLDFPGGGVVDLHHRLQQAGCPAPVDLGEFINEAESQQLGETAIPIPSFQHALLISALNFCKELFHRQPSARYAFDFAVGALQLPPELYPEFAALVRRQGLDGPVRFTIAACDSLFGPLPGLFSESVIKLGQDSSPLPLPERIDLARLVFAPHSQGIHWPRRRTLLWQYCGGKVNARCSLDFAAQVGRIAVDEVLRAAAPDAPRVAVT